MKKYNLSKIMKRAWKLVKEKFMNISSALKKSWREAKMEEKMVELKGTEKQVAWATQIREDAINTINRNIALCEERNKQRKGISDIELQIWNQLKEEVMKCIGNIDSASKIIDLKSRLDPKSLIMIVNNESIRRRK